MIITMLMDQLQPNLEQSETLRTFAIRLGRQCFLEYFCDQDHPVLISEYDLVMMARSKLMENLLSTYSKNVLEIIKPKLIDTIMMIASQWIKRNVDDPDIIEIILTRVRWEILEVFPFVH